MSRRRDRPSRRGALIRREPPNPRKPGKSCARPVMPAKQVRYGKPTPSESRCAGRAGWRCPTARSPRACESRWSRRRSLDGRSVSSDARAVSAFFAGARKTGRAASFPLGLPKRTRSATVAVLLAEAKRRQCRVCIAGLLSTTTAFGVPHRRRCSTSRRRVHSSGGRRLLRSRVLHRHSQVCAGRPRSSAALLNAPRACSCAAVSSARASTLLAPTKPSKSASRRAAVYRSPRSSSALTAT